MRAFRQPEDSEQGDALVLVIASIFLIGVLVTSLIAVTLSTTAKAASTRAHSQALAAAEGGVEATAQNLFAEGSGRLACPAPGTAVNGSIEYQVVSIQYARTGTTSLIDCPVGTTIPDNADMVRIVVEGTAQDRGSVRNQSGNSATVERIFTRANSKELQAAVFTQGNFITNNGGITIPSQTGGGEPGDVLTQGKFTCTSGSSVYSGNVYALGGFQQNNPCTIRGNLYIRSSEQVQISTKLTVEGDLIIDGNVRVSNQAVVTGTTYVTGNIDITSSNSSFGGKVLVGGALTDSNGVEFKNELVVKGNYTPAYAQSVYKGNVYVAGTFGGTNPNVLQKMDASAKLYMGKPLSDMPMDAWAKGQFTANYAGRYEANSATARNRMSGAEWELPVQFDPEYQEANGFTFPEITVNDPMFQGWDVMSKTEFSALSGMNASTCVMNTSQTTTLKFSRPTKIDLSGCVWKWSWAPKIEIYSDYDVAFIIGGLDQGGGGGTALSFRSVSEPVANTPKPKLYIIEPVTSSPNACVPSDSPGVTFQFINFKLTQTGWEANPTSNVVSTEMVLYSSKNLRIGGLTTPALHAQVYACNLSSYGSLQLYYSPLASSNEGLAALATTSIRDITN